MKLRIAAAMHALGMLPSEVIPDCASNALEEGYNSPTLAMLAGETDPIMSNVGPMFERALKEVDVKLPTKRDAADQLAVHYSNQILSGEITPYEGSSKIWHNAYSSYQDLKHLAIFAGLASEWEDFEDIYRTDSETCLRLKAATEKRINAEAQNLVNRSIAKSGS